MYRFDHFHIHHLSTDKGIMNISIILVPYLYNEHVFLEEHPDIVYLFMYCTINILSWESGSIPPTCFHGKNFFLDSFHLKAVSLKTSYLCEIFIFIVHDIKN